MSYQTAVGSAGTFKTHPLGIGIILIGLAVAIVPIAVYQAYEAMPTMEMKCLLAAQAAIVIGAGIAVLGILYFFLPSPLGRLIVAGLAAVAAVLSLLLPTQFAGLCEQAHMSCNMITLPVLIVSCVLLLALSAAGGYFALRSYRAEKAKTSDES